MRVRLVSCCLHGYESNTNGKNEDMDRTMKTASVDINQFTWYGKFVSLISTIGPSSLETRGAPWPECSNQQAQIYPLYDCQSDPRAWDRSVDSGQQLFSLGPQVHKFPRWGKGFDKVALPAPNPSPLSEIG